MHSENQIEEQEEEQEPVHLVPLCAPLLPRSCHLSLTSLLFLQPSASSLSLCKASCLAQPSCSNFTFHQRAAETPCILHRFCLDTEPCASCLSGPARKEELCVGEQDMEEQEVEQEEEMVLVIGGFALDYVGEVEAVGRCETLSKGREVLKPRARAVTEVVGGEVVVCGGRTRLESCTATCEGLVLESGMWRGLGGLVQGREDAASAVLGGRMMVLGGWDGENLLSSVEILTNYGWQQVLLFFLYFPVLLPRPRRCP